MIGTGFVNIDKYLGANQGAGADLQKSADDLTTQANAGYSSFYNNPGWYGRDANQGPDAGMTTGQKQNRTLGDTTGLLQGMGSAQTAGRAMAGASGSALGSYSPQMEAIDRAIYGNTTGGQNATSNIATSNRDIQPGAISNAVGAGYLSNSGGKLTPTGLTPAMKNTMPTSTAGVSGPGQWVDDGHGGRRFIPG